jgi:NAD(P)H-dependent FMN reductase
MPNIGVIISSTRPGRVGAEISRWIHEIVSPSEHLHFELIDLADWHLPNDEPGVPAATAEYTNEHTKAWSQKIASLDGFIFVTPQYNRGYPASLKNALDHLYKEWANKPALIISYGFRGGGLAAGQLKQVIEGLQMKLVATMPAITLNREMYGESGILKQPVPLAEFAPFADSIRAALTEFAEKFKESPVK